MKVLIVEDDTVSRNNMHDIVTSQKHQTKVAEDGAQGLELFKEFQPDLIFTDIQMPKMDGLEMLAAIRERDKDVIVIVNTAFGTEDYALKALKLNANNYLSKPVHFSEVVHYLKKYEIIIKDKTQMQELDIVFVRRLYTLQLPNTIGQVPRVVDHLLVTAGKALNPDARLGVRLGLVELITNAIEHGNLGITYEEKGEALDNMMLGELYLERLSEPKIADRRVTIDFEHNTLGCQWVITDEGDGFDWRTLPDPTSEEAILASHGRGIFISRFQFDEMEFIGAGNAVRIFKKQ
ncbi:response regulator [Desulfococcaceae bacterium HSG7]|nr:response regulator [Desulfococcaceae bacterium HSG7]